MIEKRENGFASNVFELYVSKKTLRYDIPKNLLEDEIKVDFDLFLSFIGLCLLSFSENLLSDFGNKWDFRFNEFEVENSTHYPSLLLPLVPFAKHHPVSH